MNAFQDMMDARFHQLVLRALHISEAEAAEWIEAEEQELNAAGIVIGHVVNFRQSTPTAILAGAGNLRGCYIVKLGLIDRAEDYL